MSTATLRIGAREAQRSNSTDPGGASGALPGTVRQAARLLLVDDDRLILATLGDGLRKAGYLVETAASGAEALDAVASAVFDLAILDVRMPGMDGIELSCMLRESTTVPFLFLSAYGDVDLVRRAAANGALGYLVKPSDVPQIVPAVEAALARAREIAELRATETRLNVALQIEQKTRTAVGLLMERHGLSRQQAFDALRNQARSQRRKIIDVAEEIIAAAELLNAPMTKDGS